ncbi:DUF368 domain-containing protein [Desulfopila aestuarii]|uniref:Putative membrane protein n=1 Tax=Desulfopila aestuarii DSM 18488 TaxID=1121416 RepID=A0A1M7Y2R8_9BACT|nr:DUF368 domain-containing protein [Desulfopila aestuarii]SHO46275.1 putative membrane protein [Desulfopila aestuarii DSM 18488]
MQWLKMYVVGFLIGLANLIPGVSGGTFALILGVYERLIGFLNRIDLNSIMVLLALVLRWIKTGLKKAEGKRLLTYLIEQDYHFITVIGVGALSCILALSSLMKYLLLHQFTPTYGYFFGLIILSVIIPWRMIKRFKPWLLLPLVMGILITVWVTAGVNPYEKVLSKSELLKEQYQSQQLTVTGSDKAPAPVDKFSYIGKYTTGEYLYIVFCGVVAISAMVLPGISGSLVMILMNQYFTVISAIANLRNLLLDDLFFLAAMGCGIVIGLLCFARFIDFALRRFHDPMVSFLVGLIIGSLYALWPFKQAVIIPSYYVKAGSGIERVDNFLVYSNINILPPDSQSAIIALLAVVAGMITMYFFVKKEQA